MKLLKITGIWLGFILVLLLLPGLLVRGCNWSGSRVPDIDPQLIRVYNHHTQELMELALGEYLMGVVAAEMPASFELEALKAQAVVARTYALRRLRTLGGGGCERNPQADICTDHTHCQAWLSKEAAMARWSFFQQNSLWAKIGQAVGETKGYYVTYNGRAIDAVFHSTCGGGTENSEDVWSNRHDYLRAKDCQYCLDSPRLTETVRMSQQEVAECLGVSAQSLNLRDAVRTASGRIIQVNVGGGTTMRGLDFRTKLGLRSARTTWLREPQGNSFTYTFTAQGYGHGVGLCQYGAHGQARAGASFQDILKFYYTGVSLDRVSIEE